MWAAIRFGAAIGDDAATLVEMIKKFSANGGTAVIGSNII
jgi:hypothetical protein